MMSKSKRVLIILLSVIVLTTFLSLIFIQSSKQITPLDPVEKLVGYMYFNKGSYDDYISAFQDKNRVSSKEEVEQFRKQTSPSGYFPGDDTLEKVRSHLKVEYQKGGTATVTWENPQTNTDKNIKWDVIIVGNRWVIKN